MSSADIPAGLYVSGAPTFLENFEDGNLDPSIIASTGSAIPPGFEGLIDSVDADDGVTDGSGLKGHSWFSGNGSFGVKFTFPPGTTAAGLVWTDGADSITFSAFGPGNVPLGTIGPFSGFADADFTGGTAEDRFFGVRDAAGIESIFITCSGGIELDHVQYELASPQNQNYALDSFTLDLGGGMSTGGVFVVSGTITQPEGDPMSGGTFSLTGEFLSLIAAAIPTPSPTPELAVDGSTAIPGGTGNFTSLPFGPGLSGNNLVFYGTGSGGQQGIYLADRAAAVGPPYKIADLNTPIPNGTGNFLSLGTEAGIIIVSGNTGVFTGSGAGGQSGLYAALMTPPQVGSPFRIADTTTAIPGGSGNFTEFPNRPSISGSTTVFAGNGANGQRGVYAAILAPPQVGSPFRVADTTTAIPGGSGNFTEFPNGPSISGNTTVFGGNGAGGQRGVYAALMTPPQVGSPLRIADTATPIPGGTGNFLSFGTEAGIIIVSGNNAVFTGSGAAGQQGIYGARFRAPALSAAARQGAGAKPGISAASLSIDGPPFKIADTATAIPGGTGNFTGFEAVSISESDVAFLGTGTGGQTGIYRVTGGQLHKVISVGEALKGKTITGLNFSRDGLSEDGAVAFQATFSDGSQGVYSIEAPPSPEELRITDVSLSGTELRFSFLASAGQSYVIESRVDLAAGAWSEVPGTTSTGNGALLQVTIPNAFAQPQQFYRVKQLP